LKRATTLEFTTISAIIFIHRKKSHSAINQFICLLPCQFLTHF
jgi:hypothetical protein